MVPQLRCCNGGGVGNIQAHVIGGWIAHMLEQTILKIIIIKEKKTLMIMARHFSFFFFGYFYFLDLQDDLLWNRRTWEDFILF